MSRNSDRTESFLATLYKAGSLLVRIVSLLAFAASIVSAVTQQALLASGMLCLGLISALYALVIHYRRCKNGSALHLMIVANAGRLLAASEQYLREAPDDGSRRILEKLLQSFRAIHETVPSNPPYGWRVALWVPESDAKLKIIASLDVSRRTETSYFLGRAPEAVEGLAWKSWLQKESLTANRAPTDERVDHDAYTKTQNPEAKVPIGCLHCQVICLSEQVVGVVSIDHREQDLFRNDEDDARAAVASLLALAMRHGYDANMRRTATEVQA